MRDQSDIVGFADLLAQAGLRAARHAKSAGAKSALSFHSLRHTATTLLHEGGVPAAVAQALIGHDSEGDHRLLFDSALGSFLLVSQSFLC